MKRYQLLNEVPRHEDVLGTVEV